MPTDTYPIKIFDNKHAYQYEYIDNNAQITLLYIHGLSSNPWGKKPESVKTLAMQNGWNFFRYELAGHGHDSGNYDETDLDVWKNQTLDIIQNQIKGDVILVGHCIGGWTSLLTAMECPKRVKGVVCTSTAPNLYTLLMHLATEEQKQELAQKHKITVGIERMSFTFTERFMDAARKNAITDLKTIPITCPVHLIQGLKDTFIDWRIVLKLGQRLQSDAVTTKLLKNANHHIQRPGDLKEINSSVKEIIQTIAHQPSF